MKATRTRRVRVRVRVRVSKASVGTVTYINCEHPGFQRSKLVEVSSVRVSGVKKETEPDGFRTTR